MHTIHIQYPKYILFKFFYNQQEKGCPFNAFNCSCLVTGLQLEIPKGLHFGSKNGHEWIVLKVVLKTGHADYPRWHPQTKIYYFLLRLSIFRHIMMNKRGLSGSFECSTFTPYLTYAGITHLWYFSNNTQIMQIYYAFNNIFFSS